MEKHLITWVSKSTGALADQSVLDDAIETGDMTGLLPTVATGGRLMPVKFSPFPGQEAKQAPEGHVVAHTPEGERFAIPMHSPGVTEFVGNSANIEANEAYFQEEETTATTGLWAVAAVVLAFMALNTR